MQWYIVYYSRDTDEGIVRVQQLSDEQVADIRQDVGDNILVGDGFPTEAAARQAYAEASHTY